MKNPRLGFMVLFSGDQRKINVTIDNVTSFSAVSQKLARGTDDVTSSYISDSPSSSGNILFSGTIGIGAAMPPGNYRYFLSGTHSGKVDTWYIDILVLAKDLTQLPEQIQDGDYIPLVEEITIYEGDSKNLSLTVPSADFSAATGVLNDQSNNVTATYCNGSVTASGETITTHNIGGLASLPAGTYGYFVTGTFANGDNVATWYWIITVISKQSVL